jgi:hypothetical protein
MTSSFIDWLSGLLNQRVVDELKVVEQVLLRAIAKNNQVLGQIDWLRQQVESGKTMDTQALTLVRGLAAQIGSGSILPEQLTPLTKDLKVGTDELAASVKSNEI